MDISEKSCFEMRKAPTGSIAGFWHLPSPVDKQSNPAQLQLKLKCTNYHVSLRRKRIVKTSIQQNAAKDILTWFNVSVSTSFFSLSV
jgi:hypothetical protein